MENSRYSSCNEDTSSEGLGMASGNVWLRELDFKRNRIKENRINAFEMKSLRQVLRIPWTGRRTNDWVFETAGVEQSLLKSVKRRKLTYFGHVIRKEGEMVTVNVWRRTYTYKAPFLEHEGVADQGHPGSATSHRGPDAEWVNYFR